MINDKRDGFIYFIYRPVFIIQLRQFDRLSHRVLFQHDEINFFLPPGRILVCLREYIPRVAAFRRSYIPRACCTHFRFRCRLWIWQAQVASLPRDRTPEGHPGIRWMNYLPDYVAA